jgi:hypothetical protein
MTGIDASCGGTPLPREVPGATSVGLPVTVTTGAPSIDEADRLMSEYRLN